jgi:6-phosphogluconolactonase (cycloisomerase 2 family)
MNFIEMGRISKAAIVSVALVLGMSACTRDYTVAFVYVTTAKSNPGVINQYAVDYSAGSLTSIGSPVAAGNDPISLVASPSGLFIYVINHLDATNPVQEFAVQGDGSLTLKNSYKIPGTNPSAIAIDTAGKFLYVTYTYQAGYSTTTPGPGGVAIFPINADNSLGTVSSINVGNNPVGITVSYFNHFVYVVDQEVSPNATVLGFSQNSSTGALTTLPGTTITTVAGKTVATGYAAGVTPSAIAEEQTARFVYVSDQAANQLIGYVVQSNGSLVPMVNGPFATGLYPVALTVDPRGKLLYVANFNANTIEGYAIDTATGTPSSAGTGAYQQPTGTGPSCVAIDPALGVYLFTADNLDNTTTGERLNPSTGSLGPVQNSPFPTAGSPTCVTVVANGAHATQVIVP